MGTATATRGTAQTALGTDSGTHGTIPPATSERRSFQVPVIWATQQNPFGFSPLTNSFQFLAQETAFPSNAQPRFDGEGWTAREIAHVAAITGNTLGSILHLEVYLAVLHAARNAVPDVQTPGTACPTKKPEGREWYKVKPPAADAVAKAYAAALLRHRGQHAVVNEAVMLELTRIPELTGFSTAQKQALLDQISTQVTATLKQRYPHFLKVLRFEHAATKVERGLAVVGRIPGRMLMNGAATGLDIAEMAQVLSEDHASAVDMVLAGLAASFSAAATWTSSDSVVSLPLSILASLFGLYPSVKYHVAPAADVQALLENIAENQ